MPFAPAPKAVRAGDYVFTSAIYPVDQHGHAIGVDEALGEAGPSLIAAQTRQCLETLKSILEESGSSLDRIVWANWSLRDAADFDAFNEEWVRWFPADGPVGQSTLMPPLQRRAGFRVSIGVIAEA